MFPGHPSDPGLRGRAVQQWLAESCAGSDGAGTNGHTGHVVKGFLPEAAALLHLRAHQTLHRQGIRGHHRRTAALFLPLSYSLL